MKDQHAHNRDTQTSTIKRLKKKKRDPVRPKQKNLPVKGNFTFLARWVAYEFKQNHWPQLQFGYKLELIHCELTSSPR